MSTFIFFHQDGMLSVHLIRNKRNYFILGMAAMKQSEKIKESEYFLYPTVFEQSKKIWKMVYEKKLNSEQNV